MLADSPHPVKTMKTTFLSLFSIAWFCLTASASQPNFLVILCDDLGRGDLSCYGHPIIETPHLDRLAEDGIQFTDCYASSPVCSPSRAGLFTGRNPNRAGVYDWIASGPVHLRQHEITIPRLLREAGYETMLSGKWHLNGRFNKPAEQPTPADHGFDHWFATHNNASPNHHNPKNFVRNGESVGPTEGYSSSIVVREALDWLDNRKEKQKPFAAFLTFHEPHAPIASPPDLVAKYEKQETIRGQAEYWANVGQVDRAVGQVLSGLEQRGLTEDTVVFFTSDNGPEAWMRYPGVWNAHGTPGEVDGVALRGMKLEVFEGGIRVAGILRWPAKVRGGQIIKEPISAVDLLPTLCELGGASVPADHHLDGTSFVPLIEGADELQRKTPLFWFYYNSRGYAHFALREGDYMFLASRTEELFWPGTPYTPGRFAAVGLSDVNKSELFNVRKDPMEVLNLANEEPERHAAMRAKMEKLLKEMQKDLPSWAEE
jgi:arylsulfatase A